MYESKKYIARKDFNKYHKSSYPRNFHNSSRYNHYKHSKYKYKYNYSNASNKFDEGAIFKSNFEEKNHKNFRIYNEERQTPFINKKKYYGKENYSLNSNWNYSRTRMKTNDFNEYSEKNGIKNKDEFLIKDKEEEEEDEEEEEENDEEIDSVNSKKNSESTDDNLNNINFNITEFNIEKAINDLLQKNRESNFNFNDKENIIKDFQQYIYKTQIPKIANNLDEIPSSQQFNNLIEKRNNSLNTFNFLNTGENPSFALSTKNNNIPDNFNIPLSSNPGLSSFNLFDLNFLNIKNNPNLPQCLNNINLNSQNIRNNPFNNLIPQMDLNQCLLKNAINKYNHNLLERNKENTDILEINVKVSKTKTLTFKIRRYDDMFRTVKIFCEINNLDIKLIRPLIIYIIKALNSIYGIYNLYLKPDEIEFLKELKRNFYPSENRINDINKNDNDKDDD